MGRACLVALVVCFSIMISSPVIAQEPGELSHDQAIALEKPGSAESFRLACELSKARREGNVERTRELEQLLLGSVPALPAGIPSHWPQVGREAFEEIAAPLWGNDVKIYDGILFAYGKRQLCIDADTVGGIYIAFNAQYHDTTSQVRIYRSTDGGANWTYVNRFYFTAGYPIQSFDMCVTDTLAGRWVLAFAFVMKTDKTSNGGGTLWWARMRHDGTGFSSSMIAMASASTAFRNPSICTDGAIYSPTVTYHYVAAEYITPATDESRGLFIRTTTNWGATWGTPDTSLNGYKEGTPVIAVDGSTVPDSMVVAFTRTIGSTRKIRIARNMKSLASAWAVTYPPSTTDDYDPAMALDQARGNAIVTYTQQRGGANENAMYIGSTDLFKTFRLDSIATSATSNEGLTSISFAPYSVGYYWRVGYRSVVGSVGEIHYKAIYNTLHSFHGAGSTIVSQFNPSSVISPVVGYDRDIGGTLYRGNMAYAGIGPRNIYFDAVDLALDVPGNSTLPEVCRLEQNYPNPFNPATTISYSIAAAGRTTLKVFDFLGREVTTLVNETQSPGAHQVRFDGSGLASGLYLYRLQSGTFSQTRSMVIVK